MSEETPVGDEVHINEGEYTVTEFRMLFEGEVKSMNTLLLNISLRPESPVKLFPIGIGYIATAMKKAGYDFDFLDIDMHRYNDAELEDLVQRKKYDVVAMGCIVTGYSKVKRLAKMLRRHHPKACIIVGNSVATSIYKILLSCTEADVAVMGEGDITIVKLLETLDKGDDLTRVKGIAYKKDGKIFLNEPQEAIEDISQLPHIDFSIFDVEGYIVNSRQGVSESGIPLKREEIRALPVNTARGCVGNCTFCYHNFRGYKYRYRTMESILGEVKELQSKYDINYVMFGDELTLFSRKRAIDFADSILSSGLSFYWGITCRADCFTKESDIEIMKRLKKAGCCEISFSLESSNPEILKAMNKHITVEQFKKTARMAWEAGITPLTSIVIGYPQETAETIADTFRVCADSRIYPSTGYLLPQPGSVMYEYAIKNGFIEDEEEYLMMMGDRQDLRLNMTKMSDEELEEAVRNGLRMCNEALKIGLDDDHLIKTVHYKKPKSNA